MSVSWTSDGWAVCTVSTPVARRSYPCDAAQHVLDEMEEYDVTAKQRETIARAECQGWRILPGTRYRKTTGLCDGVWTTYRAREDLSAILDAWARQEAARQRAWWIAREWMAQDTGAIR